MSNSTSTALSSGVVGATEETTDVAVKPAKAARKGDNSKAVRDVAAILSAEDIRAGVDDLMAQIDGAEHTISFAGQRLSYFIMCQHAVDTANAKRGNAPVALDKMHGEEGGKQVRRPTYVSYLQGIVSAFRNGAERIGKPTDKVEVSEDGRDTFKMKDDSEAAAFRKQQAFYNRCSRALRLACILATHKVTPFDWDGDTDMWMVPVSVIVPGGWTATGSLAKQDKILLDDTKRWNVENMTNDVGKIYASVAQADYAFEHRFDRAPAASKADAVVAKRGARPGGNTATATPPATSGTTTPVTTTTTVTPVVGAVPTTGSVGNLPAVAPKNNGNLQNVFKSSVNSIANCVSQDVFSMSRSDLSPDEINVFKDVFKALKNILFGDGQGVVETDKTPPAKTAAKSSK